MDRIFPMTIGTATIIWNTMVKNAGLYKLDPNTHKPVFGTHSLRRYFLSHFSDRDMGDFFSGHITPRNKEYRQYSDEELDKIYKEHINELKIFELEPDLTETHKEIEQLKKDKEEMQATMEEMKAQILELRLEKLENANGIKKNKKIKN